MFFPSEVRCEDGGLPILPEGADWFKFMIVGQGRFVEDDRLLDECEALGLIKRSE